MRVVVLLSGLPLVGAGVGVKFVGGPGAASWAARQYAEQYQVRLDVGSWRLDLTDTAIEARNVSVQPLHRRAERGDRERYSAFRHKHLMDVGKVEIDFGFDYSLAQWLALAPLRHLVFDRPALLEHTPLHHVRLSHVRVNVERRLPGHGNWDGVLAATRRRGAPRASGAIPAATRQADVGGGLPPRDAGEAELVLRPPPVIVANDVDLIWIHQFHIGSEAGSTRRGEQVFDMRVHQLEVRNLDLDALASPGRRPRRPASFWMDGQLGEGLLQADGSLTPSSPTTAQIKFYFDGVGLSAIWRDQFGVLPTRGRFTGVADMEFTWGDNEFEGKLAGYTRDLEYSPGPAGSGDAARRAILLAELSDLAGRVEIETRFAAPTKDVFGSFQRCFGRATLAGRPVAQAEFASLERGGEGMPLTHTERIARELAAEGGRRVAAAVGESLGYGVGEATGQAAEALLLGGGNRIDSQPADPGAAPGQRPASAETAQVGEQPKKGNALTRGVKKLGRGVKRVFGGGKKKRQQEQQAGEAAPEDGTDEGGPEEPPAGGY